MTLPSTTRRALIAGVSAAAVALPASDAFPSADDQRLFAIEQELSGLMEPRKTASRLHDAADEAASVWVERNPQPRKPAELESAEFPGWKADLQTLASQYGNITLGKLLGKLSQGAASEGESAQHAKAMKEWEARKDAAPEFIDLKEKEASWEAALDLEWELLDEASSIAPTTLGAFVCKARILDICREHGDLAASIVDDLVAWPTAKLSANQKAVRS